MDNYNINELLKHGPSKEEMFKELASEGPIILISEWDYEFQIGYNLNELYVDLPNGQTAIYRFNSYVPQGGGEPTDCTLANDQPVVAPSEEEPQGKVRDFRNRRSSHVVFGAASKPCDKVLGSQQQQSKNAA